MYTRSTTILDLPTEILSQIDHYLHSTNDRLACLSVCSRWYSIFKISIYHWIYIQDRTQFQQLYPSLRSNGHFVKVLDIQQQLTKEQQLMVANYCPNVQSFHADQQETLDVVIKSLKRNKIYSLSTVELPMGCELLQRIAEYLTDLTVSVATLPLSLVRMEQLQSLAINVQQGRISRGDLEYLHDCFPKLKSLCIHIGDGNDSTQQEAATVEFMGHVVPCALHIFKYNGIQQNNNVSLASWIQYICQKYLHLKTLELEDSSQHSHQIPSSANDMYQHLSPWYLLANHLIHLSHLSLFGYTLDQTFFGSLTRNKQKMRVLKLSTIQPLSNQQRQKISSTIPISSILKQYQDTLEELVFWPSHIVCPILDLVHPHLQLCQHLKKLHISGIHVLEEDAIDIPIDTLVKYGIHLLHLKLEYITLSCSHYPQQQAVKHKLQHASFANVTLANNAALPYLSKACPQLSHLSLVSCQFVSNNYNVIHIDMPTTRLDFFNLHSPSLSTTNNSPHHSNYRIQINQHPSFYISQDNQQIQVVAKEEEETEKLFINKHNSKNSKNNKNNIIAIIIQCCSMDQFYLCGRIFS